MEPWLFTVGKTKVVAGLGWVSLNDEDGENPLSDLKSQAKSTGRKHAAFYPNDGGKYRLGAFAPESDSRRFEGAVPVAAWLAEVATEWTVYIEATDDSATRWWIVVVRPSQVDMNTDVVVSDDDAVRILDGILGDAVMGANDDERKIRMIVGRGRMTPTSAIIDRVGKTYSTITAVLQDSTPPACRIKQVIGIPRGVYFGAAGVLALAGVVAGGYYVLNYTEALKSESAKQAQEEARIAEEARLSQIGEERMATAIVNAAKSDTDGPTIRQAIQHCQGVVSRVPRKLGGWVLADFTCDPDKGQVEASYQRDTAARGGLSTQGSLEAAVAQAAGALPTLAPLADSAKVTFTKDALLPTAGIPAGELPPFADMASSLTTAIQMIQSTMPGVTVQFTAPTPRSILYVEPAREDGAAPTLAVPADRSYQSGQITISGADLWRMQASGIEARNIIAGPITFSFTGATVQWAITAQIMTKA